MSNIIGFSSCLEKVKIPPKLPKSRYLKYGDFPVVSQEASLISGYCNDPKRLFKIKKPVVVFGDHTRVLKYIDFDFVQGADGVKILQTRDGIDPKYFYYLLTLKMPKSTGYARHFRYLKELYLSIPSLVEQQRTVERLDVIFAEIKQCDDDIKMQFDLLHRFHMNAISREFIINDSLVPLSDLAIHITDGDHQPPPKSDNGIPFITISDINKKTNEIDFSNTFFVSQDYFSQLKDKRKPKEGDVLYSVTGSFGIPILIRNGIDFCFQRHIAIIRPKSDVISEWLYYLLQSPFVFNQASKGATGTAQKTVSLKVLREIQVPKIHPNKQRSVIERMRKIDLENNELKSLLEKKTRNFNSLKLSILSEVLQRNDV